MRWIPRVRILLARRPWIYWTAISVVAVVVGVSVAGLLSDIRRARESWGETTTALVAVTLVEAGEVISDSYEAREVPLAMVPPAALTSMPPGAIATQKISVGEIVLTSDVDHGAGPLALLPSGWLAMSVQMSVDDTFVAGAPAVIVAAGSTIAPNAVIVRIVADGLIIGVPADVAPAVADMVLQRLAVVALAKH